MTKKVCGILLLTHGRQGEALLESLAHLRGEAPPHVAAVSLIGTERRTEIEQQVLDAVKTLRRAGGGVLLLSDLFGSTQATIADKVAAAEGIVCAHGVNLAMLLEAVDMRHLPPAKLQKQIIAAGKKSVCRRGHD